MSLAAALVVLAAVLSVPAIFMGHRGISGVRIVKTAVTALLFVAAVTTIRAREMGLDHARLFLVAGLAVTVLADWFLAPVDNSRTFAFGLAAFMLAYLLYGVAVLMIAEPWAFLSVPIAVAAGYLPVAVVSLVQYLTLRRLEDRLRVPVALYVCIAANLLAAALLLVGTPDGGSADAFDVAGRRLLLFGAAMIYLSDSLIAHNLFRRPLPGFELWIMPTYYAGQIAITVALIR